jgi:arylsulfatase
MNWQSARVGGITAILASVLAPMLAIVPVAAQQTTGTVGSPSATTTVPGNQLPAPVPKFGGVIKETLEGSKTWWPPRIVPPKGAPILPCY